jgi:hypothetical protein
MRFDMRRCVTLAAAGLLFASAATAVYGQDARPNGSARSPALAAGHGASTNYMERTATWPAVSTPVGNTVSFDYIVDCEQGGDQLKVFVNGVEQDLEPASNLTGLSGLNRAGRAIVRIASAGGPRTIRFAYVTNGTISHGRDLAIVDNVRFSSSSGGVFEQHRFDSAGSLSDAGWTAGGTNGGFRATVAERGRTAGRPREQAYVDSSTSFMQRTVSFPACLSCGTYRGAIEFDYLVDSEAGHDWLRVFLDGVQQDLDKTESGTQGISGRNRAGSHRLRVTSAGPHNVRFEYVKNGSISRGRDLARIDRVRFVDGDRREFELHQFTARDLDATPIRVGGTAANGPIEWSGGSTGLGNNAIGWTVRAESAQAAYVPLQQAGGQLKPSYEAFTPPPQGIVDGNVTSADYDNATRVRVVDASAYTRSADLRLVADGATGRLYIGFIGKAATPAEVGNESGTIQVRLDGHRAATLRDRRTPQEASACPDVRSASAEDRYIEISYTIAPGSTEALTPAIAERKGDCKDWAPLDGAASWLAAVKVREAPSGHLHAEIGVTFPAESAVLADEALGFSLRHFRPATATGGIVDERWPIDAFVQRVDDVSTWATLYLSIPSLARHFAKAEQTLRPVVPPSRDPYQFRRVK